MREEIPQSSVPLDSFFPLVRGFAYVLSSIMDQQIEGMVEYIHIDQNEFVHRKHRKQKEEDIAICDCSYNASDPESACGERCLNVLTSTECTSGCCPCGEYCRNQRFQRNQYARTKLFRTEGRGWGLLADENIKRGQFIIEYCGEVISWKEAKRRSQAYENQGMKDAFIISLNASESIDATRKGSLGRFINHSCQPNCETRKWNVLGEIRVGIFAKQDILIGTELSYDYNFEWYGGAKVRCLCGAVTCSGFLGAKSRGFQEDTYLWEDDDDRYSVENIPLYDSAEDEPTSKLREALDSTHFGHSTHGRVDFSINPNFADGWRGTNSITVRQQIPIPIQDPTSNSVKTETTEEKNLIPQNPQNVFPQRNAMISRIKSNSACRNYQIGPGPGVVSKKRSKNFPNGKPKSLPQKQLDPKLIAQLFASSEARDELLNCEDMRKDATEQLDSLYNEIRPAIEEHERDSQDSVATSVAEKWIEASCLKLKAEFDLYSSVIKHVVFTPRKVEAEPPEESKSDVKYLTSESTASEFQKQA
ncbi:histone-lysine N-methyltransferase ASHH1 isoform X1 [Punica granatum]|nr:histone-lysine N-methyltransferase ASHH1 isoform X1 [Punica granatum]